MQRAFGCPAPFKSPQKIILFRTLSLDIAQTSPSSGPGEFNSGVQWHQSYLATHQKAHSPISIMGNKKYFFSSTWLVFVIHLKLFEYG